MTLPGVTTEDFEEFTGFSLSEHEAQRVGVMLDRARRRLLEEVEPPPQLSADELLDWRDAVSELAHLYWEAEKASTMEILALPVSQLSLGTLFWTKEKARPFLWAVDHLLDKWHKPHKMRFVLEGELGYGVP